MVIGVNFKFFSYRSRNYIFEIFYSCITKIYPNYRNMSAVFSWTFYIYLSLSCLLFFFAPMTQQKLHEYSCVLFLKIYKIGFMRSQKFVRYALNICNTFKQLIYERTNADIYFMCFILTCKVIYLKLIQCKNTCLNILQKTQNVLCREILSKLLEVLHIQPLRIGVTF